MNNHIYAILLCLAAAFLSSCQEKEPAPVPEPEMELSVSVADVRDSSVSMSVGVNDEAADMYYWRSVIKVSDYEAAGGDAGIIAGCLEHLPELRRDLVRGNTEEVFAGLEPETEYYAYALELSREGVAGDAVEKVSFTTQAADYPPFSAEIFVDPSRSFMLSVSVSLENGPDWFCTCVIPLSEYEAGTKDLAFMQEYFDRMADSMVSPDEGVTRKKVLESLLVYGDQGDSYPMYLAPQTGYMVAVLRTTQDGTVTGFVCKETETAAMKVSDGTLSFEYGKYYDGSYLGFPGMAAVPLDVTPSEGITDWIYSSYRADYTSENDCPDYMVYSMMLDNTSAITNTPYIVYILPWDTEITLLGFVMDQDKNFGKVARLKLFLEKDKASDIHDYLVPEDAAVFMPEMY